MRLPEHIIGWISEELAAILRQQGKHLQFARFSKDGQPVHIVRRAA
ncbi:hypothetical protein ACPRNU_24555 [Chromobacterium vaccinii]